MEAAAAAAPVAPVLPVVLLAPVMAATEICVGIAEPAAEIQ